jgi:hypothetical protein
MLPCTGRPKLIDRIPPTLSLDSGAAKRLGIRRRPSAGNEPDLPVDLIRAKRTSVIACLGFNAVRTKSTGRGRTEILRLRYYSSDVDWWDRDVYMRPDENHPLPVDGARCAASIAVC